MEQLEREGGRERTGQDNTKAQRSRRRKAGSSHRHGDRTAWASANGRRGDAAQVSRQARAKQQQSERTLAAKGMQSRELNGVRGCVGGNGRRARGGEGAHWSAGRGLACFACLICLIPVHCSGRRSRLPMRHACLDPAASLTCCTYRAQERDA